MKRFPTQCYVAPAQSCNVTTSAARSGREKRCRTDSLPALETVFQQCSSTKSQSFSRLAQVDFQRDYCFQRAPKSAVYLLGSL